ncbi:MAG TPA: hypothetical protein VLJ39_01840, partial [Tepidisphaeraceae bacterium]|nr:hypothetical protein [Tepidisphaeraceae bacterium]
ANKDRAETRRAFAAKCASYLQQGIGLVVVDIVTSRRANLHDEMVQLMGIDGNVQRLEYPLYAVAYRPMRDAASEQIETWTRRLSVSESLPTVPLAIDKGIVLPLDLESSYNDARSRRRIS